jgi:hypothetical protein
MSSKTFLKLAFVIGGLMLGWAAGSLAQGAPRPNLPATPPQSGQSDSVTPPARLDSATRAAFGQSCAGFAAAEAANQGSACMERRPSPAPS